MSLDIEKANANIEVITDTEYLLHPFVSILSFIDSEENIV